MVAAVFGISALCIVSTVLCKVMERYNKEYSLFISVGLVAIAAVFLFSSFTPLIDLINSLFSRAGLDNGYTAILFKSLGICYVTQLACDVCKDNGENAISTISELSGKLALLLISVPLFETLIGIINKLTS